MWNSAMELFRDYMGTGWIVGFFMVAVVYLFFTETDKAKRLLFIYIPVVLLLIYFNPLFCKLDSVADSGNHGAGLRNHGILSAHPWMARKGISAFGRGAGYDFGKPDLQKCKF